jgi:hypothetical protein
VSVYRATFLPSTVAMTVFPVTATSTVCHESAATVDCRAQPSNVGTAPGANSTHLAMLPIPTSPPRPFEVPPMAIAYPLILSDEPSVYGRLTTSKQVELSVFWA